MQQQENFIVLKGCLNQKGSDGYRPNLWILVVTVSTIKALRIIQSLTWYAEASS